MKKLKKENKKNKSGFDDDEIIAGSKEAKAILNNNVQTPVDIMERNKKFDLNYIDLNYNLKIKELRQAVYEFSGSYFDKMITLAVGGHDCALKIVDSDFLIDALNEECNHNQLLSTLRRFYYVLGDLQEELRCVIVEQHEFITKKEFEVFMN